VAGIEPHIDRDVAAVVELYSTTPPLFARTAVTFEIADNQDSVPLVTVRGEPRAGVRATTQSVQAVIDAATLPPGRYVLRARITRDGNPVGLLVRPFVRDVPSATAPVAIASLAAPPPPSIAIAKFDRAVTLAPALMTGLLDGIEKRGAGLKRAISEARAGRYGAASLEAFNAGDQTAAAFLKGLDFYTKGELDQAANQLNIAAGPRREFFPAAFYLGAAFAAAGRDRDAAAVWQMGIGVEPRPTVAYTLFADARLRDNQPQSVIDVLQPAWQRSPTDDEIARRLGVAYIATGRHAEAIAVLDAYLLRHPDDPDALLAGVVAQYEVSSRAGVSLSNIERDKLTRYVRAYQGPQKALLEKYLETLRAR
jgi:hypothetical protein